MQHAYQKYIISTQHIHLYHDNYLEIIAIRCSPSRARKLTDALKAQKGVKHVTLSMSSTGKNIGRPAYFFRRASFPENYELGGGHLF